MKFAKTKLAVPSADILNESDLRKVEEDVGIDKREQLEKLNRKVRQFEDKVARDEVLVRNRNPGNGKADGVGSADLFNAQNQVND